MVVLPQFMVKNGRLPLARVQWERGLGVRELLNAKKVNEINKSSSLQPSVGTKTSVD
ncbi:hypothetical protein JOD20_001885 [Herpetosiphon giganteus]|nr:hypothetical protein [Herpetosiphon giganteus]